MLKHRLLVFSFFAVVGMALAEDGYLHSDGTQYIDTKYIIKSTTRVELDVQLDSVGVGDQYLFGTAGGENGRLAFCSYTTKDGKYNYCCRKDSSDWVKTACNTTTERRTIILDGYNDRYSILDGAVTNYTEVVTGVHDGCDSGVAMPVFAAYNFNNKGYSGKTPCKLFSLKIYEADVLVRDFKPCVWDGEVGLRDTLSDVLCIATAGNPLTYGGDIEIIDDGYIESTGEQYVDTGYCAKGDSRIEIDLAFTDLGKVNGNYPFGLSSDASGGLMCAMYVNNYGYCGWICKDTTANWGMFNHSADTRRHTFVIDGNANRYAVISHGVTNSVGDIDSEHNGTTLRSLLLFASRHDNIVKYKATMRLYGFRAYESGTLVKNYVPCVKGGVAGLKETISGSFYCGISTGEQLSAGGNVMREADDPYVKGDGFQAFETGVHVDSTTRLELDFAPDVVTGGAHYFLGSTTPYEGNLIFGAYIKDAALTVICQKDKANWPNCGSMPQCRQKLIIDILNGRIERYVNNIMFMSSAITTERGTAENSISTKAPLAILGARYYTSEPSIFTAGKVYGCKIYKNNELVRDYKPYVQNSVAVLRDEVTSSAIGVPRWVKSFSAGGTIEANVEEDAFLSSSQRQAIDTGYLVNENSRIEIDFALNHHTNGLERIFGTTAGGDYRVGLYADSADASWGTFRFAVGAEGSTYDTDISVDVKRHMAVVDMPNRKIEFITGENSKTISFTSVPSGTVWPLGLFGEPADAEFSAAQNFSNLRIYSVKISENGKLVHHFLPYRNGHVVGMKDIVTGTVKMDVSGSGVPFKVGCRGWGDEHEAFFENPKDAAILPDGSAVLSVFAPGAVAYQWMKDGEEIKGADGTSISIPWQLGGADAEYSVRAFFDRYGVLVESISEAATLVHKPCGMRIIVR